MTFICSTDGFRDLVFVPNHLDVIQHFLLGRHGKKFVTNLRLDHSMDKSNLIVVLKLPIRNIKAVRTLSIPPYICLFDLMKMSEKSNTSAPFQLYQIHPQWKGHQDFQQNHSNKLKVIKIV